MWLEQFTYIYGVGFMVLLVMQNKYSNINNNNISAYMYHENFLPVQR